MVTTETTQTTETMETTETTVCRRGLGRGGRS